MQVHFRSLCKRFDPARQQMTLRRAERLIQLLGVLTSEYELRRCLMGYLPVGPFESFAHAMSRLLKVENPSTNLESLFPHPPNEVHPDHAITAASVLEGLGILKESIFAVDQGEANDLEVMERAELTYTFALSFAKDMFGDLFDWTYQPVELEAALGLSLWLPFEPSGPSMPNCRWRDVEVGHRYLRIIAWLRKRAKPLTDHDSLTNSGRDDLVRQLFQKACHDLKWPSPFQLAETWLASLQSSEPWSRTNYFWWCLGEKRLRTASTKHLLAELLSRSVHGLLYVVTE